MISLLAANSPSNAFEYPEPGVFEVVKSESDIRVLVYRAGLLGGFGHNHVISTSDIVGGITISDDPALSSIDLQIPVDSFEVDVEALRVEEGDDFESKVSDKAKRGTQENIWGDKVLNVVNFPNITIRSGTWLGEFDEISVTAEITVRDQTNRLEFPASVSATEEQIVVTGNFTLTHGQLGLKPFKAFLGGLRVRDEMRIKFRITVLRVGNNRPD